jgi:uncharacterized protein YjcR
VPRGKSELRIRAFQRWLETLGQIKLVDLAREIGVADNRLRKWKAEDKWDSHLRGAPATGALPLASERSAPKRAPRKGDFKPGPDPRRARFEEGNLYRFPEGNQASRGHQNALKHGLRSKLIPVETLEAMAEFDGMGPADILWLNIRLNAAAILRAQQIMLVRDQADIVKELKSESTTLSGGSESFEVQFAWDRHQAFMVSQARAMTTLARLLRQYEEMLPDGPAAEEQRLRVAKLKAELATLEGDGDDDNWTSLAETLRASQGVKADGQPD